MTEPRRLDRLTREMAGGKDTSTRGQDRSVTGSQDDDEQGTQEAQEVQQLQEDLLQQAKDWQQRLQDPMVRDSIEKGHIQVSPLVHKLLELVEKKESQNVEKSIITKSGTSIGYGGIYVDVDNRYQLAGAVEEIKQSMPQYRVKPVSNNRVFLERVDGKDCTKSEANKVWQAIKNMVD